MTKRLQELVELALDKKLTPNTRTELVKILFTDEEGDIWLSGLQLQNFEGNLYQGFQQVKGNLNQDNQRVKGNLWQNLQTVEGNLYQNNQIVEGDLKQFKQEVNGSLSQQSQKVKGYLITGGDSFAGKKEVINGQYQIIKEIDPYEDMSREELIEELKKVKGESHD